MTFLNKTWALTVFDGRLMLLWERVALFSSSQAWEVNAIRPSLERVRWWPHADLSPSGYLAVPLWLPVAALSLVTALFWYRDCRRFPAGHCRNCGYNLTGNVSGRCPECGLTIPS